MLKNLHIELNVAPIYEFAASAYENLHRCLHIYLITYRYIYIYILTYIIDFTLVMVRFSGKELPSPSIISEETSLQIQTPTMLKISHDFNSIRQFS